MVYLLKRPVKKQYERIQCSPRVQKVVKSETLCGGKKYPVTSIFFNAFKKFHLYNFNSQSMN